MAQKFLTDIEVSGKLFTTDIVGIGVSTLAGQEGSANGSPILQVGKTGSTGSYNLVARFGTDQDQESSGASVLINAGNDRGLLISAGRGNSNRAISHLNLIQYDGSELTDGITLSQYAAGSAGATSGTYIGMGISIPLQPLSIENSVSPLIKIRNTTNGGGAGIEFNDNGASTDTQNGQITYYHADSASQGGGSSFHLTGENDQTLVVGASGSSGRVVVSSANSSTEVGYGFYDDVNTGMTRTSADNVSLVAGGVRGVGVGTTAVSLKYGGVTKIATSNTGTNVTGEVVASGRVSASEFDLPSGGKLDWANGDARIVEGLVNNYSLSLQTYDGTNVTTALRLDGDNTASFAGDVNIVGNTGTILDVQGSLGQLFSVTDSLTGDLFSVSDVSGSPILNVNSNGNVDIDGKLGINNNVPAYSLDIALDSVNDRINVTAGGAQKVIINGYGNIIAYGTLTSYNNSLGGGGGIFTYKGGTGTQTIGHRFQHVSGNFTGSSGDQTMMQINPTINQTSTAGYTGIKLNVTETATGSGTKNLLDLQVGGTSKASISNTGNATFAGDVDSQGYTINESTLQGFHDFQSRPIDADSGMFTVGGHGMALGYTRAISMWSSTDGVWNSWVGTNLRWDGTNFKRASDNGGQNWGNIAGIRFLGNSSTSGAAMQFIIDPPEQSSAPSGEQTIGTSLPTSMTALSINNDLSATFAGNIVMAANATVDGVDISALPTTFAPTNAEQNVQSDWNATSGDAQILNKLNRKFTDNWGDDRFVRTVGGPGANTGDKWVSLSTVAITGGYEKVKIEFTIGSYDDNTRGDERITVLYENHSSAQEGHILHWYYGDQIPTLFKAVKSIRSASSGLTNTYDLYVQIDGAWKDTFTVHAKWWETGDAITYPTTAGGSTPTAGSDDKSLTSRERWVDADKLDGQQGTYYLDYSNATNTPTIPADHGDHDGLYLPIGGGTLTGDLKINTQIGFQRDGTEYSNYIKSSQFTSAGYDNSGSPPNDRYWLEYGAKGGHHFIVNTDGGVDAAANTYDLFTIWQGEVDGNNLFQVNNVGNTSVAGNLTVGGNLTVEGTVTTLNTATIEVEDNILQLNTTQASTDTATATTSGISIYRGVDENDVAITQASLIFDDGDDTWDLTNKLKVASNLNVGGNVFTIEANNPYIRGTGTGSMRIKHTSGQTMYIRPDETGSLSFFEGANSQSVYFMTKTPTVDDTTNESAKLLFHTRSKQSDGNAVSKYATIKHLTHDIGYNYTTLDFAGSNKSKFNMPIEAAGGLYFTGDTHMGFIPHPRGAQFRSDSSALTGYIKIELPTDIGTTPDDMVSFYVDVYDYTTNETISVFIAGYTYTTTATTASYWYNPTAIITTKQTAKDFNVRYGYDGTHFYVAIGETTSVWSHPSIVVRDFQCSYRSNVEHYIDGWDVSVTTTTLTGVDETQTGNLPQAKHATTAGRADTATALHNARTIGGVSFNGTANINLPGVNAAGNQNTSGSSASCTGNSASANYASDYSNYMLRRDNRVISPSEDAASRMRFGFTSWGNDNSAPYADFLHMRSYSDTSGGSDNLVMFKKSGIGMRIWQQGFGSSTAYASYENVYSTTYEHKQANTNVASGATRTRASVDDASFGVFFDFLIKKGTNVRAGTLTVCHDGTNVEFAETSTIDLGNTGEVVLTAVLSGGNVVLQATTQTDSWSIKSLIRAL